jgi:undecaprenyl-diphosphatase
LRLASELREGELGPFDRAAAHWLELQRGSWDTVMLLLTHSGGELGMTVLCVSSVLLLAALERRKEATFVATCGIGAYLLSAGLKLLFHRARPEAPSHYLIALPGSFSFPSGHALGSATVVGSLVVIVHALRLPLFWRAIATSVALAYVVGVAASRVYFGVHYPSDVLGGQLCAAAWIAAVTGWFYPRLLPGESSGVATTAAK